MSEFACMWDNNMGAFFLSKTLLYLYNISEVIVIVYIGRAFCDNLIHEPCYLIPPPPPKEKQIVIFKIFIEMCFWF